MNARKEQRVRLAAELAHGREPDLSAVSGLERERIRKMAKQLGRKLDAQVVVAEEVPRPPLWIRIRLWLLFRVVGRLRCWLHGEHLTAPVCRSCLGDAR